MTPPNWITPVGHIGDVKANTPINIGLQASGATAYALAGGSLPEGTSLTAYGTITGTPHPSAADVVHDFIVHAICGAVCAARSFSLGIVA